MPSIDFESALAEFLDFGRRLQTIQPLTAQRVLDELTNWYRDVRIEGAVLNEDADMLLLQWGAIRPLVVSEPVDLRYCSGDDLEFVDHDLRYLDFTRQVFVAGERGNDFDDSAVQMSITLAFGPADGSEPNSNRWIRTPDEIDRETSGFLGTLFVRSLLSVPAKSVVITIDNCG